MPVTLGQEAVRPSGIDIVTADPWIDDGAELLERKGIGHPDSICDALAALLSRTYAAYTVRHCDGQILHHQFDKVMLIGGRAEVDFGGGRFVEPIRIVLSGRVSRSYLGHQLPVHDLLIETICDYFANHFPMLDFQRDVVVTDFLTSNAGPGTIAGSSGSIANMFAPVERGAVRGYEELVANDTSYCVGYAPLSPLEAAVLELEKTLSASETHVRWPWLGTDIKIMAFRQDSDVDVTACIPQIAAHVPSLEAYHANLETVGQAVLSHLAQLLPTSRIRLSLNTKDRMATQNVYLTVTGASLSGDIGVVGRGNRPNGLITSRRPMSPEGTNGKNPLYYSGFVYAVCAKRIAERVHAETGAANAVEIVAQNGGPLYRPWHTRVTSTGDRDLVRGLVDDELKLIPQITEDFLADELVNH